MAHSPIAVWKLALTIGLAAFLVRWRTQRVIAMGRSQISNWALREYTRRNPNDREHPLRYERARWIEKQARLLEMIRRDPPTVLRSRLYLLPQFLRKKVNDRLRYSPNWASSESWDIIASWKIKYQDEKNVPIEALRLDGMLKHFGVLLECTGARLCILAPEAIGARSGCGAGRL